MQSGSHSAKDPIHTHICSSSYLLILGTLCSSGQRPQNLGDIENLDQKTFNNSLIDLDLQSLLHVDLSHVEQKVNELVHKDRFFSLVQGELLDKDYLDQLAEEINETLQEAGQVRRMEGFVLISL